MKPNRIQSPKTIGLYAYTRALHNLGVPFEMAYWLVFGHRPRGGV